MSTPYAPVNGEGAGEGEPEAAAEGVADRDAEAAECEGVAPVPGRLHAPARTRASAPSDAACRSLDTNALPARGRSGGGPWGLVQTTTKGNATIRIGLRFRYHPA